MEEKQTNKFLDLVKQQDDKFDSVIKKLDALSKSIKSHKREQLFLSIVLIVVFCGFTTAIVGGI